MSGLAALAPLLGPLSTGADLAASRPAACGECHAEQYADWDGSRHHAAHTNLLYQAGLRAEPEAFCVNCHAPLAEQAAEVLPNLGWYREAGPHATGRPAAPRQPEPLAEDGVGCAVCHLRGGTILTPTETTAVHPTRHDPALASGEVCRPCHEFPIPEEHGRERVWTDVPMQRTWTEWEAWGGGETCVDCHMPDGRHLFRGAHDLDWLRASLVAEPVAGGLTLRTVGVGHAFPTGDLFRHLTVERWAGGWREVAWIGRRFALEEGDDGRLHKVLAEDTTLAPGEVRLVPLRGRWRVRYHYGSAQDEARAWLPEDVLVVTVAEGR